MNAMDLPHKSASGFLSEYFPSTNEMQAIDARHHVHPFSDMRGINAKGSRIIVRSEGCYLWDSDGNRIIDGMSGLWCVNVGHGRIELAVAAFDQMKRLSFYNTFFGTTHPPIVRLSQMLAEIMPKNIEKFFFVNSGSEANETAMRIALRYWQAQGKPSKQIFIARMNGYHGSTVAAASLGGMSYMHDQIPCRLSNVVHVGQPYWYGEGGDMSPDEFGIVRAREIEQAILQAGADNVAAVVGEPFQGAGGVIFPPKTYWPEVQRICRKYDVLICADEVIGGFGRTGRWFSSELFDLEPDIVTFAKGLTSGYIPMGGTGITSRVAKVLTDSGEFHHGMTYSGHPVAAAVAIANIEIIRRDGLVERVSSDIGPFFQALLRDALADCPIVGEVSGEGLVAGIQLVQDKKNRTRFSDGDSVTLRCNEICFANNLVMRDGGDRMLLAPPLTVTRFEIEEIVSKARRSLDQTAIERGLA